MRFRAGGGGRDRRGGAGGEHVGSQRTPCPCAPSVTRRGPARWSRSMCTVCLEPRAQPGRNRWVPRPRPPLPLVLAPRLPLPAQVPCRKRSGMRSPAASQPGQRFLPRPGSSLLPAGSAFVWSASGSGEDHFRASSFSQLCTLFPRVAWRPGKWRGLGCAVSGCGQEEMGVHLLTTRWQSPGHAGSRGPPPGKARGCQKPRATPPTRVA